MENKLDIDELKDKISFNTSNVWDKIDKEETEKVFQINEDYKEFLDKGKTERESIKEIIKRAEEKGFKSIEEVLKENTRLLPGDKIYINNKGKGAALFVIGKNHIEKGMNIIGSHVDSPRLDIKQNPLYEDSDLAFLKTHYYGGVKKYQWVALPLALHGIILKKSGERIDVSIGEDHDEPVFYITDLLPHLAKNQMSKTLSDGITGEGLNILVGSIPFNDKDIKDKIKFNILKILYEKYGMIEEDFIAAELELVPAGKARDLGFDRSLVMAYGHDDRV